MLSAVPETRKLRKVFIKNDRSEFLDNLNIFWPETVYFSKRTLWLYFGNHSWKSSNEEKYLFQHFNGNEVWPEGLKEAIEKHSSLKMRFGNYPLPAVERVYVNDVLKIGDDLFRKNSEILHLDPHISNSFESNLKVPVLEVAYSFLTGNFELPDTYQFKAERMYSLRYSGKKENVHTKIEPERKVGIIRRKKIPQHVREIRETHFEYEWVEPDLESLRIPIPEKIKIIQGIPEVRIEEKIEPIAGSS